MSSSPACTSVAGESCPAPRPNPCTPAQLPHDTARPTSTHLRRLMAYLCTFSGSLPKMPTRSGLVSGHTSCSSYSPILTSCHSWSNPMMRCVPHAACVSEYPSFGLPSRYAVCAPLEFPQHTSGCDRSGTAADPVAVEPDQQSQLRRTACSPKHTTTAGQLLRHGAPTPSCRQPPPSTVCSC